MFPTNNTIVCKKKFTYVDYLNEKLTMTVYLVLCNSFTGSQRLSGFVILLLASAYHRKLVGLGCDSQVHNPRPFVNVH